MADPPSSATTVPTPPPEYAHLQRAFDALRDGDTSLPVGLFPNCMHHSDPRGPWDEWENGKWNEQMDQSLRYWRCELSAARRALKVLARRTKVPSYCCKSEANLRRWKQGRWGRRGENDAPLSWPRSQKDGRAQFVNYDRSRAMSDRSRSAICNE